METATTDTTMPPRVPSRGGSLLPGWLPAGSLALGCVLSTLALFLPWEHITVFNSGVPGNYETGDVPVTTILTGNPNYTISDLLFAPTFHRSLGVTFADALWHAAVPLIGVALLLAFFSWRARWLRWPLLAAFALWSVLLGVIGANYLVVLREVTGASYAELSSHPPQPSWWTRLIAVGGIYGERNALPAWGWYVLWAGLALSAVGIVWCALRLWRPITSDTTPERARQRMSRRWRIALVLCTVAFVVWAAALLALPVATLNCPAAGIAQSTRAAQCQGNVQLYVTEAVALAPVFTSAPATNGATLWAAEWTMFLYLRTLVAVALALVAAPFALAAVWRASRSRGHAIAAGVWGALVLVVTWTAVFSALAFIRPQHTPGSSFSVTTPLDPAPGIFVLPLAALALVAGLALRWLPMSRRQSSPTPENQG